MSAEGLFGPGEQKLVDMLQMWGLSNTSGILTIESGPSTGTIHFKEGKMVWAKAGEYLEKEDALYHILALEEGKFRFVNSNQIEDSGISYSYNDIIMEGMRRLDHLKVEQNKINKKAGFIPYIIDKEKAKEATKEEQVFIDLIDNKKNLFKIMDYCGLGSYKSVEVFNSLMDNRVINLRKITVLVVDDQKMWRDVISNMLEQEDYFKVIGRAEDGVDALEKLSLLQPDVMTLDLEMPRLNGLKTLYWMMSGGYDILLESEFDIKVNHTYRCPVVVISAIATKMAPETLEALMGGSTGYITKPSQVVDESMEDQQKRIAKTVKMASQVDLQKTRRIKTVDITEKDSSKNDAARKIVCVGASMVGGLTSIMQLVPQLPEDLDGCVYCVIDDLDKLDHARSFAEFLNNHSKINVEVVEKNTFCKKGVVYISPGNVKASFGTVKLGDVPHGAFKIDDLQKGERPIDSVFLNSLKCKFFDTRVGVILAGDGDDGKIGSLEMSKNGDRIFSQDSYSSLNPIKPEKVANTGVTRVAPLSTMVKNIVLEIGTIN